MRRVIGHYLPDELRPRNFTYGLAAIARYCRPQERPPEIARLLVANWGPALRAHLVYATAKRGGESLPGRALRMVMRAVVPYSTRRRIRAHLGADKED
jgi:hypothetical protein